MLLADAELLADLRLGHAVVEEHEQDLLPSRGQLAPVRGDGLHAKHVLHLRVLLAEKIGRAGRAGLAGQRRVQRGWLERHVRQLGISQIITADPQVLGKVGLGRGAAQFLGVSGQVAARTSVASSFTKRLIWICQRLSRKCRLISPVMHGCA